MPTPDDYVTEDARYAEAHEMGGAPAVQGMAPYPLYGLPTLGQDTEASVPFYKRPVFCYAVGGAVGLGIGWAFFGWFKPKYMKRNPNKKRRTTRNKKSEGAEES